MYHKSCYESNIESNFQTRADEQDRCEEAHPDPGELQLRRRARQEGQLRSRQHRGQRHHDRK